MTRISYGKITMIIGILLALTLSFAAFAADEPAKTDQPAKTDEPAVAADPVKTDEPAKTDETTTGGKNLVPLKIELPKPLFVGTPKPIPPSPHLEPLSDQPRPAFLAPAGAETNVARGKRVKSSDKEPIIGDMEQVTDGDKEASDGCFVELAPGLQWVQVDLGAEYEIYAVVIWHYHAEQRVYRDVVVRVADDPDFVTDVKTVFNNDYDNSAKLGVGKDKEYIETYQGKLINAKGVKGRYVRLYSEGNTSGDMNHYTEVEVYGKPASK